VPWVIVGPLGLLVVAIVLAAAAGRVLGVRRTAWRTLAVGVAGVALGTLAVLVLAGSAGRSQPLLRVASAAMATLAVAALVDLVLPVGSAASRRGSKPSLPHPLRALRRTMGRWRRYIEIARMVARSGLTRHPWGGRRRHGHSTGDEASAAVHLREALQEAGGIFVKLGQFMSTRADLLPADVVAELSRLQDGVAPAAEADIRVVLVEELGMEPEEVFCRFEAMPIAAASIAQVHLATTRAGGEVVVKVQRPGLAALLERDLDIMLKLARTAEARSRRAREYRAVELAEGFAASIREELDFRVEARNIAAVRAAMGADPPVVVPTVHADLSTARVLVMDRFDGAGLRDAASLLDRPGVDRRELGRSLLHGMLTQLLVEGTFHADPHPGNVMVLTEGGLALIDFGAVGRLDPLQLAGLRAMVQSVQRRDPDLLRSAVTDIARVDRELDERLLEQALAHFMAQRLGRGMAADAAMFNDLFRLVLDFGLVFPPDVAAVFRCLATLEGTLQVLAPGFPLIDEVKEMGAAWLMDSYSVTSATGWVQDELIEAAPIIRRLPRRVDRIATAVEQGRLTTNVRLTLDPAERRMVARLVDRAVLAFLAASLGLMSVLLLGVHGGPTVAGAASVYQVLAWVGLCATAALMLRVIVGIGREGRG
jgi:ubiquinone biosynthesis protein